MLQWRTAGKKPRCKNQAMHEGRRATCRDAAGKATKPCELRWACDRNGASVVGGHSVGCVKAEAERGR